MTAVEADVLFRDALDVTDARDHGWRQPCFGQTEVFYPPPRERPQQRVSREARAKAICADCPAKILCRESGRRQEIDDGAVWGGEGPDERRARGW